MDANKKSVAWKYKKNHGILVDDQGRGNMRRSVAKLCQRCTDSFWFWLLVALTTLFEPVLCSRYPKYIIWFIQIILLAFCTVLYFIQLIGVASKEWEKIHEIQLQMQFMGNADVVLEIRDQPLMKLFLFFTAEEEYMFEFACLTLGWALIIGYPGIAVLRCFRVFRLLWFYEVKVFRSASLRIFNPIFGKNFMRRLFNVLKFAIKALTALIDEMFRIGHRTRGGIILIMMFFYTAFILGIVLWIETNENNEACTSIGTCTFTLMRLTFYDGNGFDFAFYLTEKHRILFCIVMFYMAITSFGLLNGLVGIFGNVFANASEDAFGTPTEEEEEEWEDEMLEEEQRRGNNNNTDEAGSNVAAAASSQHSLDQLYQRGQRDSFAGDIDGLNGSVVDDDEVKPFDGDITSFDGSFSKVAAKPRFANGNVTFSESNAAAQFQNYQQQHYQQQHHAQRTAKPAPSNTNSKASYSDLKMLHSLLQQNKKRVHPINGSGANANGNASANAASFLSNQDAPMDDPAFQQQGSRKGGLFSVPARQKSFHQTRSLAEQSLGMGSKFDLGGATRDATSNGALQQEMRQMREDMKALLQMQLALQQQLGAMIERKNSFSSP